MRLIGVGVHRTGTTSVQTALGYLGLNAYHGRSLWWHPDHIKAWLRMHQQPRPTPRRFRHLTAFDAISGDFPAFCLWRKLCAYWPDAKVLLTVRDPEVWADSFEATILTKWNETRGIPGNVPVRMLTRPLLWDPGAIWERTDRASLIDAYCRHNQAVQDEIPADRLLVMDVKDGWGRLAEHIGLPTPDRPFPNLNAPDKHNAKGTYFQIWVKGETQMVGIGWGQTLEEACLDYASRNPEWARDFDQDRLLHGGRMIVSERP